MLTGIFFSYFFYYVIKGEIYLKFSGRQQIVKIASLFTMYIFFTINILYVNLGFYAIFYNIKRKCSYKQGF